MVPVVQLVRTPGCDSGGRGFEPHRAPHNGFVKISPFWRFFCWLCIEENSLICWVCFFSFSYSIFPLKTISKTRLISAGFSLCKASLSRCVITFLE